MRIVDAHQHVWDPTRADYPWLTPELRELDRIYGVADVQGDLDRIGIDATVLVQAADNLEDTANMLRESAGSHTVAGVVVWLPLERPSECVQVLDRWLAAGQPVVGVRHLVHREPDPDWALRPDVLAGLSVVAERGLTFDFCAESLDLLTNLAQLADRLPALTIVLDHLGKPPIASQGWQPWAHLLTDAARHQNVVAKLSGLNTAAAPGRRRSQDYQPYVDHALHVFGPRRLMYGSDWPFALQAADSYQEIWSALRGCLDGLTRSEIASVLAGTAESAYRLPIEDRRAATPNSENADRLPATDLKAQRGPDVHQSTARTALD